MSTSSSVNPAVADTINGAAGPEVTAELVRELSVAFQAAHDALKHFVGTVRRFENHVRTLRTEATTLSSVQIHTLPPPGVRRGRGRPRGSRNRTKHIWILTASHRHTADRWGGRRRCAERVIHVVEHSLTPEAGSARVAACGAR